MEREFCQDTVLLNFCKSQCSNHPNVVARVAWFDCHIFKNETELSERTEPWTDCFTFNLWTKKSATCEI